MSSGLLPVSHVFKALLTGPSGYSLAHEITPLQLGHFPHIHSVFGTVRLVLDMFVADTLFERCCCWTRGCTCLFPNGHRRH